MIIKEIKIKNFRSYYGDNNTFDFSDGLTLIVGDNGDGKTTFFEALHWLLNTTDDKNGNVAHISEMRRSELEVGERDEVSVFMLFEHGGGLKSVEKSFYFERAENGMTRTTHITYRGHEVDGVERGPVDGKRLINTCYDAFIQRFSMFKGESELNVFDSHHALKDLVEKFSDIREFDKNVAYVTKLEERSDALYRKDMSSDTKIAKEAKVLETKIMELSSEITDRRAELRDKLDSLDNYTTQLDQLEVHKATAENYKNIQERLKTQEDLLLKKRGMIMSVNYNHNLLDQMWVLCAFPSVLKEFKQKCSALSKEKRIQEKDFDRQRAYEIGKLDAVKELRGVLENGTAQLPWYLPDENTMEEMINDHICKVCGREAPEGSDAYKFMVNKLETYRKHLLAETKKKEVISEMEEKELFTATHIESLHNLSISLSGSEESKLNNIVVEIHDRLELNERIGNEIKVIEQKIADIKDEKARLLIQAGNVSEQLLEKEFSDIRGLFDQKERTNMRIQELEAELTLLEAQRSDIKNQLDKLDPEGFQVKISRDVNRVLHLIAMAFSSAKKENLRRFLSDLEESANKYLVSLSANDFHGQIHFVQRANSEDSPEIRLFSSNGTEIKNPSGSQKTVMYISVLFAISEFTSMKRDEDYPLIFDAATSSFSDSKENDFYNVIDKINKQCIIVTKDFIEKGELRRTEIDKLTCSVYRIRKAQGFNKQDMATIRTIIEKVK